MNLHSIVSGVITAINPNYIGTLKQGAGYGYNGDAAFTGAIAGNTLTVSSIASGALIVGSTVSGQLVNPGTVVTAFGSGSGGVGTYTVSGPAQTVPSAAMSATGDGTRTPLYTVTADLSMQVQALSARELEHLDGLNIQDTVRSVHMNGQIQGVNRVTAKGGDLLLIPTGLSGQSTDTWLVRQVLESYDNSGWSRLAVVLQKPPPDQ